MSKINFKFKSDSELYELLLSRERYSMPIEDQLALLQEIENRIAKEFSREPIEVMIPQDLIETAGCYGFNEYVDGKGKIVLNPAFFDSAMSFVYSSAKLLDTLLHEGRHQSQNVAIKETKSIDGKPIPPGLLVSWTIEKRLYTDKQPWYFFQMIESDARMFALHNLRKIEADMRAKGMNTFSLRNQIYKSVEKEKRLIASFIRAVDFEDLKDFENDACRKLLKINMDQSTHIYHLMWFILRNKDRSVEYIYHGYELYYKYLYGSINVKEFETELCDHEIMQLIGSIYKNPLDTSLEKSVKKLSNFKKLS